MFESTLDTEHVFGHHGAMSRTRVRRRRRIAAALGSVAVAIVLTRSGRRGAGAARAASEHERAPGSAVGARGRRAAGRHALVDRERGGRRCRSAGVGRRHRHAERHRRRARGARPVARHPARRLTTQDGAGTVRAATTCCGRADHAMPLVPRRGRPRRRLPPRGRRAAIRRRRECLAVRAPVHDVRAGRGRRARGRQAGRLQGSVRPGQARRAAS